jgi:hypothetical protein
MRQDYGLMLAPDGDWAVIDYSLTPLFSEDGKPMGGTIDCHTEDGRGFTLIVAPAAFVDKYLRLDGLTGDEYLEYRAHRRTDGQKKQAIENFFGFPQRASHIPNPIPFDDFTRETTEWEQRVVYTNS